MATAPKKAATARRKVALDLDALEREGGSPEPFTVNLGGQVVAFVDPNELDWQDAASLDPSQPFHMVQTIVAEKDREHVFAQEVPVWKMRKLFEAYRDHYGLGDPGNSDGSPS